MGLVDRHTGFVQALREAGLPVSPAEGLDAARSLRHIDLLERETLRAVYAATLVKRPAHRPQFDVLFDLWFPAALGAGEGNADRDPGEKRPSTPPALDPEVQEMRRELLRENSLARVMLKASTRVDGSDNDVLVPS